MLHIPHSRPRFGSNFSDACERVLASGQVTSGGEVLTLESEVEDLIGVEGAVAVDSGTSALMLAIFALKTKYAIKRIGIPAYTCRAVLHAVLSSGIEPVCMDCDEDLRLDQQAANQIAGNVDAVIMVHPFGLIEPSINATWRCPVIEDIAQATGGRFQGKALGSFGDISVLSCYATKPWGGACGGMIMGTETDMEVVRSMSRSDTAKVDLLYAGNHQLSDLHAALSRVRISMAVYEMMQRKQYSIRYDEWFVGSDWTPIRPDESANKYRYIVRSHGTACKAIKALHAYGIKASRPVETPISILLGEHCPGAEAAWRDCVSLPLLPDMNAIELEYMHKAVTKCML